MSQAKIKVLSTNQTDFYPILDALLSQGNLAGADEKLRQQVAEIILEVKNQGDAALLAFCARFDASKAEKISDLRVDAQDLRKAWEALDSMHKRDLELAQSNISEYAQRQKLEPWEYQRPDGSRLAQKVVPLDSVGIYVPGGRASYPSSVLMNAIPAQVAGVPRIVMMVPAPNDEINPMVLASAHLCGVEEVWKIGGAQAIAALAYGTQSIAPVDKITGPGNRFVAEAKRQVFGKVGIDMVAGPSEVVIIADASANPEFIAADLFAQAEHDEQAQSILLTDSEQLLERVLAAIEKMLPEQPRQAIIAKSLSNRGALISCPDLATCAALANYIAPEHLELNCANSQDLLAQIRHSGAIFVGESSNEVFGDYCAGTNHVLPTSGTARFSSGLGASDFQKRISVLELSSSAAQVLSPVADRLAQSEGLFAHALSARLRANP